MSTVASRLGESEDNVARGMKAGVASLFAGIAQKTNDAGAMQRIFQSVSDPAIDGRLVDDPSVLIEGSAANTAVADLSQRFTSDLFGSKASAVNSAIEQTSGLRGESVQAIMRFAAPIVLAFLGRRVREGNLNLSSFTQLFAGEKDNIMRAAPAGLAGALGLDVPFAGSDREVQRPERWRDNVPNAEPAYTASRRATAEPPGRPRWVWPTVGALALLGVIWMARGRNERTAVIDSTNISGGEVAPIPTTPAPMTPTPTAPLSGTVTVLRLPNSQTLTVAENSAESKLVGMLVDRSGAGSDTTWFALDRLNFAPNSTSLTPESNDQIQNVAKILAAYPETRAKIGGFTDNAGNPAANKRLSAARAASVRSALVAAGASPSRLTSAGFGQEHPIADNSTEEGRAQNRRVGILITKR